MNAELAKELAKEVILKKENLKYSTILIKIKNARENGEFSTFLDSINEKTISDLQIKLNQIKPNKTK